MSAVLITGADGYFGSLLTEKYLSQTDRELYLWVKANKQSEYDNKLSVLEQKNIVPSKRIKIFHGNLVDTDPFYEVNKNNVSTVIHTAAITRFNVEEKLANQVNRDGTRKAANFASQCNNLDRFAFVSTIYSSGLHSGEISESAVDPNGPFANHYERSKGEAEQLIQSEFPDLPWNIFRAATIISDDDSGKVVQYNVFHNTMRLLFYGLISLMPGHRETPIYLTTGRSTTDAIYEILDKNNQPQEIYNVCYSKTAALSLGELVDRVFENFGTSEDFRKKRILKPLFTELEAFESLSSVLKGFGGAVMKQALDSIRPFSKQLFIDKDVSNGKLISSYPDYSVPDMDTLIDNVIAYLVQTKWGREG